MLYSEFLANWLVEKYNLRHIYNKIKKQKKKKLEGSTDQRRQNINITIIS